MTAAPWSMEITDFFSQPMHVSHWPPAFATQIRALMAFNSTSYKMTGINRRSGTATHTNAIIITTKHHNLVTNFAHPSWHSTVKADLAYIT